MPGLLPAVSSMYVSPSSVFWRRIARASELIGANCGSISIVACVVSWPFTRLPSGASWIDLTVPTDTPPTRTSDSVASCVASGK